MRAFRAPPRPGMAVMSGLRVAYSFPHRLGEAGIGTTALHQVLALHELGCRVTVWCASSAVPLPDGIRMVETLSIPARVGRVRLPQRALGVDRSYAFHDRRVAAALRRRGPGGFDVVHTWPLGALATLRTARELGIAALREVPNTHTAHAVGEVGRELEILGLSQPQGHSHTSSAARLRREQAEYDVAAGLLVPSAPVSETFLARGVAPERLHHHGYGYDPETFRPARREPQVPFTAVFAGRCEPRKGLHYALRAWRESGANRAGRLLVCGSFDPDYRRLLADDLADESVVQMDFCNRLNDVLAQADVMVLPSVEEGSALVSYEAMGSGCVPLVSVAAGAPVRHGHDGLVHEPRNVDELAGHLARVLSEPPLLATLREHAVASAAGLRWIDSGRRLVASYEKCRDGFVTEQVARRSVRRGDAS